MTNHALTISFALIVGFFLGTGVNYAATQLVVSAQQRKLQSVMEAGLQQQIECAEKLRQKGKK